jgi:hypothetical protein
MLEAFPFSIGRKMILLTALLLCSDAIGVEPAPTPEARAHFDAGVRHLEQGRHAEAYRELKAAYAITARWTILGNLGIAAERLERDGEAIDVMREYLERGVTEIDKHETLEVQRAIDRLEQGSASVTLEATGSFWIVDTRVHADGTVVNEYGPFDGRATLRVRAGEHEIRLKGEALESWRAVLVAGDTATHAFETPTVPALVQSFTGAPVEPPAPERNTAVPSHTASYVMWGVGAAGVIATAIIAVHASSLQSDADAEFARNCSQPTSNESSCTGTTDGDLKAAHWRTGALITGAGALGALIGGTIFYFLDDSSASPADEANTALLPWFGPEGVGMRGTF